MERWEIELLAPRLEPTSDHSVTVWDRDRAVPGAEVIGTVNAGPNGVEAHRPHDSLAERSAARVAGDFPTVGDAVTALIADHESGNHA